MSGAFGDMGNLLKQAQQMQRELDRAREELRGAKVEGSSGGGAVRVEVNGDGQVTRIHIRPETLEAKDAAAVEALVLAAVRDGIDKAQVMREERLARLTGGLNLPGLL
jgi:DNA-binding YbaB/EbfC family protein